MSDAGDAPRPPRPEPRRLDELADPAALVFDLDGTLVDTVGLRIEGWLQTFEEVGIPADREHVSTLIGADGRRLAQEVAAVADRPIDAARAEAIDRRAGELYGRLNTDPRPLPGVTELLRALQASDLAWAIGTSSRAEQVMTSVEALGLDRQPKIIDGSHVEHAKPAPDLLLLAAERLATPPRACWYVGDATWDMLAARAANMVAIGIPTGSASAEALAQSGADAVATMEELAADLRRRGLLGS
jgi:HAD superfamily hydrolase (TIGR01509 family)